MFFHYLDNNNAHKLLLLKVFFSHFLNLKMGPKVALFRPASTKISEQALKCRGGGKFSEADVKVPERV